MPVFHDLPPFEEIDPDKAPRGVVALGIKAPSLEHGRNSHRKGELLFPLRGMLTCEVDRGLWLVPPLCAIWIPANVMHSLKSSGEIEGYGVFVNPAIAPKLRDTCCTISVTPLLRELLVRAASLPFDYQEGGSVGHLVGLLLAEIAVAPVEQMHLPMPDDARLRSIVEAMIAAPSERGTVQYWAQRAGLSERNLARLLARETGMSFGRWRQQLSIMMALRWMANGMSVQRVAEDLGYESAGSFITMFRKALGVSPARYMTTKRDRGGHVG
jgi:AraC-like DNA-binding protein